MKWIRYYINTPVNTGTDSEPVYVDNLSKKSVWYTEDNIALAEEEAYNGEYTIDDDGIEEVNKPTQLDKIEAQVTYTAMMTDTLLEV